MDIQSLRSALVDRRGQWGALALKAQINRKTVERIVHEDDYMPTLRTMLKLQEALRSEQGEAA